MKEQIREIEQIMQQFYAKQQENEILFNANKTDEENLKNQILELKDKRLNERKVLKGKLDTITKKRQSLVKDNIQNKIPKGFSFRDSYKLALYNEKEQILLSKIEEFEAKEKRIAVLKNQLESFNLKINSLLKPYLLGIEEHDSLLKNSFMGEHYKNFVSDITNKINVLTDEISKKQELERELRDLRIKRDKYIEESKISVGFNQDIALNTNLKFSKQLEKEFNSIKTKMDKDGNLINSKESENILNDEYLYIIESLDLLNNAVDTNFNTKLNDLKKKSEEEKALDKQIKLISTRPNYNKVYLREMFELKYSLLPLFTEKRQQLQYTISIELNAVNKLSADYNEQIKTRDKNIQIKKQELVKIKKQLDSFELKYDKDNSIINYDAQKQLLDNYSSVLGEIRTLEAQNVDHLFISINQLANRKQELEAILSDLQQKSDLLCPTTEEVNAYASKMELYEQEEYDRRKALKNGNISKFNIEKTNNLSLNELKIDKSIDIQPSIIENKVEEQANIVEDKTEEIKTLPIDEERIQNDNYAKKVANFEVVIPNELEEVSVPVIEETFNEPFMGPVFSNDSVIGSDLLSVMGSKSTEPEILKTEENEMTMFDMDELKKKLNAGIQEETFNSQSFYPDTDVKEYVPNVKSVEVYINEKQYSKKGKKLKKENLHNKLNGLFDSQDDNNFDFMDFCDDGSFKETKKR